MKDEQLLLNNQSLDELIKMKIEEEFKSSGQKPQKTKRVVEKLSDCPKDKIFSNDAVFKLYNRLNKTETYINGTQADAMIGIQHGIREKILDGTLTAFSTDDAYVKFEKAYV